jgi:DNA-binding MarR family transcriptional regulator
MKKQITPLAEVTNDGSSHDLEEMTLSELLPHWTRMLWLLGMRPLLKNLLELNLTMSENIVLRQLQRRSLSIADVASELSLTHSAASRTVDRLVRDGYVERVENPADRRQKVLTLTVKGAALMQEIEGKLIAGIEFMALRLSPEEQERFRVLIARMVAANCLEHDE